ncbi:hypothetical protein NIES4073_50560 [Kalymmatonema gypsitolerans NIES-4073]|nr:hypothetical protein NIES4073_50560 [Scytonema sp. NIES-4073]
MNDMNNTFVKGMTRRGMMLGGAGFTGLAASNNACTIAC